MPPTSRGHLLGSPSKYRILLLFNDRARCVVQIVVATTEGGAVCGGYNPAGWIGLGDDRDSIAAFLFTWPDGDTSKDPAKLKKAREYVCPHCHAPCSQTTACMAAAGG